MTRAPSRVPKFVIPALSVGFVTLLFLVGCLETTLHLGEAAKVDRKFVGDWTIANPDNPDETAKLVVRNIDDKQYYVEWTEKGKDPTRMKGYLVAVKSATFAEITNLAEDGTLPDKHVILRIELKDGKLVLRHLNERFFESVKTDKDLRAKVEANLDNKEMYEKDIIGVK